MHRLEEQFEEVRELMKELMQEKRDVLREKNGWKGKGWKDDFEGRLKGKRRARGA